MRWAADFTLSGSTVTAAACALVIRSPPATFIFPSIRASNPCVATGAASSFSLLAPILVSSSPARSKNVVEFLHAVVLRQVHLHQDDLRFGSLVGPGNPLCERRSAEAGPSLHGSMGHGLAPPMAGTSVFSMSTPLR